MRTINVLVKVIPVNSVEEGKTVIKEYESSMPDVWGELKSVDNSLRVNIYERVEWEEGED